MVQLDPKQLADRPWLDPNAQPQVVIDGVCKTYPGVTAVDDVRLSIFKGEMFALVGSSGCGKTTLLRMLAGFETPTSGRIVLNGQDLAGLPPYERPLNMMFQSYALFPHLTVWDNIAFGLRRDNWPRDKVAERVEAMLKLVQLGKYAKRKPHQLSGGQQQRVALARSLAKRPQLLLLDEPLGALDKKLREQMQREIKRVSRERRISVLYVTHDQEEALTMSDRIAVFNRGRIEQIGTPTELYERPATRFVADFLGDTNFFAGTVLAASDGRCWIEVMGRQVEAMASTPIAIGAQVVVAVRPERVTLHPAADDASLSGRLTEVIYLGAAQRSVVRLADGADYFALHAAGDAYRATPPLGASVGLSWERQHAMVFPV